MSGPVQLTEVDFDQIKNNLISYLKSTKQFTDYDFDGSNLQVILNLISYQSQLNAYNTNMIANESFLASSTLRNNVVSNARMVGFVPASAKASRSEINFEFQLQLSDYPQGFPLFLEMERGLAFSTNNGLNNLSFNIIDTQTGAVDNTGLVKFEKIEVLEGIYLRESFTCDKSDYNQRFILKNPNIDVYSLRIEVQEDPNEEILTSYSRATNLVEVNGESKVYWIEEVDDRQYELNFGDNYFGVALQDGAKVTISYLVTNGVLGNGVQGASSYIYAGNTKDSYGTEIVIQPTITSVDTSDGGDSIEDVTSIKNRAPKFYSAQNRAVVSADYETLVKEIYPGVDDIYVYGGEELSIPEYGRVYVAIKPLSGDRLSALTKNYIKKSLQDFRIASLDIQMVDPTVLYVETETTTYYDDKKTTKDNTGITSDVKTTLVNYGESDTVAKFGGSIRYSKILGAIDESDISITRNNTVLRMRRDMIAIEDTLASYEICFTNPINPDEGIYSTGFTLVGDTKTYYFEDDKQGNIYSFYFDSLNSKIIVNKKFGTVDYEKGEVFIGYDTPINITSTNVNGSIVEVRAYPVSQDIIARQSVYLSLDVAKSDINSVVDTQLAGE